jgi:hypothetical protein
MYWLSFTWWIIFYVNVSGYGKPVGYPKPAWVWVWAKFYTRHGYEFFSGRIFSSRVWVWASNTQRVFTPVAISSPNGRPGTGPLGPIDKRVVPGRPACRRCGLGMARRPGSRAWPARLICPCYPIKSEKWQKRVWPLLSWASLHDAWDPAPVS